MPNYQNAKIYKLLCFDTGLIYIGSTIKSLSQILGIHKAESNKRISKILRNPKIYLIKNTPCNSKEELKAIEKEYINKIDCINKIIPTRTKKEYYEDNKEYLIEKMKIYNESRKEKKKIYDKLYYQKKKNNTEAKPPVSTHRGR
tara:strand:- start:313 stop:744 length:432 start_codon:yes stop_codon:yes gene_type:complete